MNAALQGYLAAIEEALTEERSLGEAAEEMASVADFVDTHAELALALNDGSLPVSSRRAVLGDLLEGKVTAEVRRLVLRATTVVPASEAAVSFRWLASRLAAAAAATAAGHAAEGDESAEAEPVLGRLASRNRVAGYAAAVLETLPSDELEEVEDELFRFARTVEGNRALRRALGDRDLPVALRQEVVGDLLGGRTVPATRRLAAYAVRGGRARDIVATLDWLVEETARTRGWRVARVRAAHEVDDERRGRMGEALGRLAGGPVELQVAIDPELLAGVVVQIGDLLVDGTTRHRLDELKEHLLASGTGPYSTPPEPLTQGPLPQGPRTPGPRGRESADG